MIDIAGNSQSSPGSTETNNKSLQKPEWEKEIQLSTNLGSMVLMQTDFC